jgi:hypothetical protein
MRVSSVPPPRTRLFSVETAADQETCGTALVSDAGGRQIPGMSMTMSEMSKVSRKSKVTKHSSPVDLAGCEVDGEGVTPGRQRGAAPSRGVRRLPAFPREETEAPVSNSASRQNACVAETWIRHGQRRSAETLPGSPWMPAEALAISLAPAVVSLQWDLVPFLQAGHNGERD